MPLPLLKAILLSEIYATLIQLMQIAALRGPKVTKGPKGIKVTKVTKVIKGQKEQTGAPLVMALLRAQVLLMIHPLGIL